MKRFAFIATVSAVAMLSPAFAKSYFTHQAVGCLGEAALDKFEGAVSEGNVDVAISRLDAGCYLLLRQDYEVVERRAEASSVRVTFDNAGPLNLLVPNRYLDREAH